jgi:acetyl-CoA carboxylase carboxyltransferase component
MSEMGKRIEELQKRKQRIKQGGGQEVIEKLIHNKGMLTARERVDRLLDLGTFIEMDMFVTHHATHFGMDKKEIPADGVVTGHGEIEGRRVFVYSQDFTTLGGSYGEMHGRKICKIMDKAAQVGVPVIGICHSGGLRLHEVLGPMELFGQLFYRNVLYSGVVPQITLIMGTVAGGQAYSPGLTDFIIMTKESNIFIAGPAFVKTQLGEKASEEELGGARMHSVTNNLVGLVTENDEDSLRKTRELLSFLPSSNREGPPRMVPNDDPNRQEEALANMVPVDSRKPFDMKKVIQLIVDQGCFFELGGGFAKSIIIGFARFDGNPVGLVASQPLVKAGVIDVDAAEKAARFVRFCDAFNIPIVTLVDTPAYMIGKAEERKGMIYRGAKLLYAYSEATVPKVTVIIRKAYAGAYIAMGSRYLGGDQVFAWPIAEIASVAPETAAGVIFKKEIEQAENPEKVRQERLREYYDKFINPYNAASRQDLDDVIEPKETRSTIIHALKLLKGKKEERPWKKHGNIPL